MKENYMSTRGGERGLTASEAIIKGLASDGGLYVPEFIHDIHMDLEELIGLTYGATSEKIFNAFLKDFTPDQVRSCVNNAYYSGKFEDQEPVKVVKAGNRWILELFHGPTCAFKDMALTILPHLMTTSIKNVGLSEQILILTATSGDTGKAALSGFADVDDISILVYYPKDGVSTIQEKQMLTQTGANTCVVGVKGNFDDTQNGVKMIFGNADIKEVLAKKHVSLSSANSINIGRLLPQVVYYFYSYMQLIEEKAVALGDLVNFVVPTGNFGDILAGYYAKLIGLPVHKLICASNSNKVLTDFFEDGHYDRNREFYKTISPSMDILISSNLERLLFDLSEGDTACIKNWMTALNQKGQYKVPETVLDGISEIFDAGYADEASTMKTIQYMFENEGYLMDPHTAVASKVYDDYLEKTGDSTPSIVLSTASPYKFGHSVYESIFGPITEDMDDFAVLNALSEKTGTIVPKPLRDLDKKQNLHDQVCEVEDMSVAMMRFANQQVGEQ